MRVARIILLVLFPSVLSAQQADSTRVLNEVVVKAYAAGRPLVEIPASVELLGPVKLNRFSNTSFVPVFNGLPGVRMEERSPGSYRFSIRGSLLRSPFGIRNVKFYWNGLPLTDGGGNTYFNLVDFGTFNTAEVIKGPGGSLYGAGTGGVVLLNSPQVKQHQVQVSAIGGSFGTQRYMVGVQSKSEGMSVRGQYTHQQSDGYREQSALRRDALLTDMAFPLSTQTTLSTTLLYSDLSYQTPGGLTLAQYNADPAQARPGNPGAEQQKAAVYNQTFYGSVMVEHTWNEKWVSRLGVFGGQTDFRNPAIRNYEARTEKNIGVRNENTFSFDGNNSRLTFGFEGQRLASTILVTNNVQGNPGNTVFSNDKVESVSGLLFAQAEFELPQKFILTMAGSLNFLRYMDERQDVSPVVTRTRNFDPLLSPRIALLKKVGATTSVYAQLSRGFSPPTVAELIPSTGIYNPDLRAETGWSTEAGVRGSVGKSFNYSLAAYYFGLNDAIVIQRDTSGADYFVNAGSTEQPGVEASLSWTRMMKASSLSLTASYTYNNYKFGTYVNDGNNYSGNALTGVARHIAWFGADIAMKKFYLNVTGQFTDRIPLNDGNTDYANDYFLLGARTGFRSSGRHPWEIFIGADNLLDQRYSLGNDLNAAGGRYYNAAPVRNYYVGVLLKLFSESE